jgi:hypothetical protein
MWVKYYKKRVYDRLHFAEIEEKRKQLEYENRVALYELAKWELSKWSAHMDVWSDKPFWQNDRGVIVRIEPNIQDYIPNNFDIGEVKDHFEEKKGKNMVLDDSVSQQGQELILKSERRQLAERVSARASARSNGSQTHSQHPNRSQPEVVRSSSASSLPPIKPL